MLSLESILGAVQESTVKTSFRPSSSTTSSSSTTPRPPTTTTAINRTPEQVSELSLGSMFGPGHEGVVQTTAFRPSLNQTEITVPAHGDGQFVALDVVIQGLGGQDSVTDPYLLTATEEKCFLNNLPDELDPSAQASSGNTGVVATKHLLQTNIHKINEVKSNYKLNARYYF